MRASWTEAARLASMMAADWFAASWFAPPALAVNNGDGGRTKVARAGSWDDRPKVTGSTRRYEYESYQKVYGVGFRVIVEE